MKIQKFFDRMAEDRDGVLESDPILQYEQHMRQRAVLELLQPNRGEWILDIGCGNVRDIRALAAIGCECVGVDLSFRMILEGKRSVLEHADSISTELISLLVGDATEIPLRETLFDKVICSEVIEHIPHYQAALREIQRVLVPGGRLVVTTPNLNSMYGVERRLRDSVLPLVGRGDWRASHPYDEWKSRREVKAALEGCGFRIERELGACYLPGLIWYRLPARAKVLLIRLVQPIENSIRGSGIGGYTMAIAAISRGIAP
jgi:ubiquinone/menaquinone biosynthesis C-methylase UbiE